MPIYWTADDGGSGRDRDGPDRRRENRRICVTVTSPSGKRWDVYCTDHPTDWTCAFDSEYIGILNIAKIGKDRIVHERRAYHEHNVVFYQSTSLESVMHAIATVILWTEF